MKNKCCHGRMIQSAEVRVKSYSKILMELRDAKKDDFKIDMREALNSERKWVRYLSLAHIWACKDGGLYAADEMNKIL